MLRTSIQALLGVQLALGLASAPASAASFQLSTNGEWLEFVAVEGAATWLDAAGDEARFDFISDLPVTLRVVDLNFPGDGVMVLANGSLLGSTASMPESFDDFTDVPQWAYDSGKWGKGVWTLPAGIYQITGVPSALSMGASAFAISAVAVVPEPQAWPLALAGLVVLAWRSKRA